MCPADNRDWGQLNTIGRLAHVAFPWTSAIIEQDGRGRVVANPNHVLFYNAHQEYRRARLDPLGYSCLFVGMTPELLGEVADLSGASSSGCESLPCVEARSDRRTALLQHVLVAAARSPAPDPLLIEELLYRLLRGALDAAFARKPLPRSNKRKPGTRRAHRVLAYEAKCLLTLRVTDDLSLEEFARVLFVSPFHLARVFRAETGWTLHGYRNQLRARTALQRLLQPETPLTALAIELGYSSASHFSDSFYGVFAIRPSEVERILAQAGRAEVSRILEAMQPVAT